MENHQNSLWFLFTENLQHIYYAEKHLADALGTMQGKATYEELKTALIDHREETKGHIRRLERVFQLAGQIPASRKSEVMRAIIKEADEARREKDDYSHTRDAGLVCATQKAVQYQVSIYGTLAAFAKNLGLYEAERLLMETLAEEKKEEVLLSRMARRLFPIPEMGEVAA